MRSKDGNRLPSGKSKIGATRVPAAAAPKPRPADLPAILTTSAFSWYTLWIALGLITATLIVYAPVRHYGFVAIDDPAYVTENPHISNGLTWLGVVWAFTTGYASNWHPLTWLSHMLDVQLFGMNAGPHHVVSLLLHVMNTILLFWLMIRLTGALGRSAFVSGLFALHPLHVESVAWVAERKDVLSTMFWLLTLLAYTAYVRRPGLSRYLLVCVSFALGLLAKPMLVTIPFVLLLLDVWPLRRIAWGDADSDRRRFSAPHRRTVWVKLIIEKLPMIALSAASSIVTYLVQERAGAVTGLNLYPLVLRIEHVLASYADYISKMLWPVRLTMLYPYTQSISGWWVLCAFLFLLGISYAVIRAGRRHPYLPVGWFWYLGTLIPVIGLVQVGMQSMADRYTYVPLIGLFVMASWGVPDLVMHLSHLRRALPVLAMLLLFACALSTRHQLMYWKSSDVLWAHAFEVTLNMDNWNTHNNLGMVLRNQGRIEEALAHFSAAVRMKPDFAEAHHNLGATLAMLGRMDEAIASLNEALRLKPEFAEAHADLGFALESRGHTGEAIAHYTESLRLKPDNAGVHNALGIALAGEKKVEDATFQYSEAIRLKPDYSEAHNNLGLLLADQGKMSEAFASFSEAVRLRPDNAEAQNNMGRVLAGQGRFSEAITHFSAVVQLKPDSDGARVSLGAALAGAGRGAEAANQFKEALRINPKNQDAQAALDYLIQQIKKSGSGFPK